MMCTSREELVNSQMEMLIRGGSTQRFHTLRMLAPDSVAEHSFMVAMLCHLLCRHSPSDEITDTRNLILGALTHDLAEFRFGDMPAPAKALLAENGASTNVAEDRLLSSVGFDYQLTPRELEVLKLADCAAGMLVCVRERQLGNRMPEVAEAYGWWTKKIATIRHPGATFGISGKSPIFDYIDRMWEETSK